ncbi:hypothetical protein CPB97_001577 [Podila verticillata]|nr:hypothetical protein CPB97_001577 [Podila verticillata]
MVEKRKVLIFICLLLPTLWMFVDGGVTWLIARQWIFSLSNRDYLTTACFLIPCIVGHLATIWGHYFRSEREFQNSISKVTTPVSERQKISLWEHHIMWGYTVKYWILVGVIVLMKITWVCVVVAPNFHEYFVDTSVYAGIGLIVGYAGGYSAIASCGIILILVLRRSMLHALGFTYAEILPLHRWLGVAIVFWSTLHTVGYLMYYDWDNTVSEEFNFYDIGRSTMNICGCFAFGALLILGAGSIPWVRRRFYTVFMALHRVMTAIFFLGTIVHYPYYMLWYYMLPSMVLFLVDRFVPKMMQRRSILPEATCTLNADADIVRMTFTSPEPMKPYYPGDYILVEVPQLGLLYHPFTIASYWPEDPYSITLFIRTYNDKKGSWTGGLAKLCGSEDKKIMVKANIDGVFGDRRHDYLKSEVVVLFAAGAAITTFMALIKAIAAQIAASSEPLRIQLHLICTFRTRSELHAYGSFLHQITRDPRFTSWLHVEIYVSRPDKAQTLMGAHAHVIKNDILVPAESAKKAKKAKRFASLRKTGTMLRRALSGRTVVEAPEKNSKVSSKEDSGKNVSFSAAGTHVRTGSVDTVVENEKRAHDASTDSSASSSSASSVSGKLHDLSDIVISEETYSSSSHNEKFSTGQMIYTTKRLPTFQDANSTSVATQLARLDLHASAILVFIPLAFWYILRAIHYEGSVHYCDVMEDMNQTQNKICYGAYSTVPPFGHMVLLSAMGYFALWLARRTLMRSIKVDLEATGAGVPYPDIRSEDEKLTVEDGNWDEGDVVYSIGRMNIKQVISNFMEREIGLPGKDQGLVTVFGGGPEAFVAHVEKQIQKSQWAVDFHRETWAP